MATQTSAQPRTQAIVPTTVEQIVLCKQPQFYIYDIPVQMVCLVGIIRKINIKSCEVTCDIQDHSGVVKGVVRLESDSEVDGKLSGIQEDNYAKIFGSVRIQDNDKFISILKMFPVDDLNAITTHLLEVACFTLEAEAERKKQLASANTTGAALADSVTMSEEVYDETAARTQFTDLQRIVFDIVRSEHTDAGITKRGILRQFPSYQGNEVNLALEYLINEGLIYFSIDQEHLKAAVLY